MSSTSSSNAIFTGSSRFSSDFQSIITRAVNIASLPLAQLNSTKADLNNQAGALGGLDTQFTALQTAIQTLQSATTGGLYFGSASDNDVASVAVGDGAMAGTYTLEVTSLGKTTSTMSNKGSAAVTDPTLQNISTASQFKLTVNGTDFTVTPETNTLDSLAKAVNGLTGANVQASIVNVGSSSSPDYRLAIQGTQLNADTIQLNDGSSDLLTTLSGGSQATYKVNGMAQPISSTSRSITLAPGLTVQLLQQSTAGSPTTISVSSSGNGIQNALQSFVNAYNSALDEVAKERGANAGPLSGQSIVNQLSSILHSLGTYQGGSGQLSALASLGVLADKDGHLSLDSSTFSAATAGELAPVLNFLGDASGTGFLGAATNALNGVEDATSGLLKTAITSVQSQTDRETTQIDNEQDRIDQLQTSLQAQMSQADAMIASLEQQVTYMTNLFQAMSDANRANSK